MSPQIRKGGQQDPASEGPEMTLDKAVEKTLEKTLDKALENNDGAGPCAGPAPESYQNSRTPSCI